MQRTSAADTTIWELVHSSIEALSPEDYPSTRWAMRRAIVWLAKTTRHGLLDDKLISRMDLKDELNALYSDIWNIQTRLRKPGLRRGLFHAVVGRKIHGDHDQLDKHITRHLEMLPDALTGLSGCLLTIGVAAKATIDQLGLEGQRGPVTPWHRQRLPAKVRFAAVGDILFQTARGLQKPPDAKNTALADFLALTWSLATGERDALDWTTAVRTARGKRANEETFVAVALARAEAIDLVSRAEQWRIEHELRLKRGAIPANIR